MGETLCPFSFAMVTQLQIINKALLSVGEREVPSSTSSSVAKLAKNILDEALIELQHEGTWNFRKTRVAATDTTKVTATGNDYLISDLYDLTTVRYGSYRQLRYYQPDTSYVTSFLGYTVLEDNTIRVSDGYAADQIEFVYVRTITIPTADTEELDLPAEFETLILKKMRAMLSLQHLDDLGTYQQTLREYELSKIYLKQNDNKAPGRRQSMYRGNRR